MKKFQLLLILPLIFTTSVLAQSKPPSADSTVKSSPAYAEILLEKVTLQAELEDLLTSYTDEFPKVKQIRLRLNLVELALLKLLSVKPSESAKLTQALGKLMLRKIEFQFNLAELRKSYNDQHPDVKRAKRKVEIFENAVNEILQ